MPNSPAPGACLAGLLPWYGARGNGRGRQTGISEQATIQVIADGLVPGMQVVTEGAERLQDFQTVQIAEH